MTTVLLTGAGGFLGSHVLERILRTTDWHVYVVDSFRHNGNTDRVAAVMADTIDGQIMNDTRARVTVVTHDLQVPFSERHLTDTFTRPLVDAVIHIAAHCSVDHSIAHPRDHVLNNITSTLTVLDLVDKLAIPRFIHMSTDEVFGAAATWHHHNPSSPYAASKAACEDLVNAWAITYGIDAQIVNSANLFGERQSQLAFIPQVIKRVLEGRPVTIHTGDTGIAAWRWYTYAPNVAEWLTDQVIAEKHGRRAMLTGQLGTSVRNLAFRIAQFIGKPIELKDVPGATVRPGFDNSYGKMEPDLTWQPKIFSDEGLARTVAWFMDHREWLGS